MVRRTDRRQACVNPGAARGFGYDRPSQSGKRLTLELRAHTASSGGCAMLSANDVRLCDQDPCKDCVKDYDEADVDCGGPTICSRCAAEGPVRSPRNGTAGCVHRWAL